jgi:acyl-CoA synthetase (AMP-forming)/AMP-acid ligase II
VAFVAGPDCDPQRLRGAAAAELPAYEVPSQVLVRESLPLNANGKIDRHALQRELKALEAQARERVAV